MPQHAPRRITFLSPELVLLITDWRKFKERKAKTSHCVIMRNLSLAILILLCSCSRYPDDVERVLESAGDNRAALEKVIEHYSKNQDEEKLRAAYFLIGNMGDKFAYGGKNVENFDVLFDIVDSLHRHKIKVPTRSPILKAQWDSLVRTHGAPTKKKARIDPDYNVISTAYLIENIDEAFALYRTKSWCRTLSFEQFCEFILPYRIGDERLELWRKHLFDTYQPLLDTGNGTTRMQHAEAINSYIKTIMHGNHTMWSYPFDIPVSKMEKVRRGACRHIVNYVTVAMRANGVPVATDFTPLWGNVGRGHEWNVLLLEDGRTFPFDAARAPLGGVTGTSNKFSKIFRATFAPAATHIPDNSTEIPVSLLDKYRKDVTAEYIKTFDVDVPLVYPANRRKEYAIICTFNNRDWVPQDWGKIENDTVHFKMIGPDIVYLAMYFHKGVYTLASDPFILKKDGGIQYLTSSASEKLDMVLVRKYPVLHQIQEQLESMIGVRFQGANKPDFSDSVNLFTIGELPAKFEKIGIHHPGTFRYVRYLSPPRKKGNIAELEFYGKDRLTSDTAKLKGNVIGFPEVSADEGTPYQKAFDGNLETYFMGLKDNCGWAGLDLGKPYQITKIRYCPRSDTNFILPGDTYELRYWKKGQWISMGMKVAKDQFLVYKDVPANGLYILHNLSRGKEERIFTYENGKQVWW
jgi:hypothetical protein